MSDTKDNGSGSSWYKTGYDGLREEEDRISASYDPRRFWMPGGVSKEFVFVDDQPFAIYEHNPKMNGDFKNWITCLKGVSDDAPCCDEPEFKLGERSRYYVGYYTIVDCSKWTDKKNNVYQYELKFLPAKLKTLKKFKRKQEEQVEKGNGGLVGCLYKATREDKKSPGVGDEFEFQRTVNMDKLFEVANFNGKKLTEMFAKATEDAAIMERLKRMFEVKLNAEGKLIPKIPKFNYAAILAPKTPKDMRSFLNGKVQDSGDEDSEAVGEGGTPGGADTSVPF